MLAILPILAYLGIYLVLLNIQPEMDWRRRVLRTAVLWGIYLVATTELISLVHGVTQLGLTLTWLAAVLATTTWLVRRRMIRKELILPRPAFPKVWNERALLLVIVIVCLVTALIAWVAPSNAIDSLRYHLPKVAHWAQNRSVGFYTTGMYAQNDMPPGSEMIVLLDYVLAHSDRLANFVQWSAMLASLIGVSYLASRLGARPVGQWLAAVFAASLPMGIAQASSANTDYVVAFWAVCAACEVLAAWSQGANGQTALFASLAAGLGLLAKPTAAAYLLPLGLILAIKMIRDMKVKKTLALGALAVAIVVLVNLGPIIRNYVTYGNPISDPAQTADQGNALFTPAAIISNIVRNAALQTGTPWPQVNLQIERLVLAVHVKLGLDWNDPRTTSIGPYGLISIHYNEITGNPLQAVLILVGFLLVIVFWKRFGTLALIYNLAIASTFLIFSALFKWQIFGARYALPFLVLFAPLVGLLFSRCLPVWSVIVVGGALFVLSWTWLFKLEERPLISSDPTYPGILQQARRDLYFAPSARYLKPVYDDLMGRINQSRCTRIGVAISGASFEYPIWVYMNAPRNDLQIEWIVSGPTQRYMDPTFSACAIICQDCTSGWSYVRNLPVEFDSSDGYKLFLTKAGP
jgi:hypothetical protein